MRKESILPAGLFGLSFFSLVLSNRSTDVSVLTVM